MRITLSYLLFFWLTLPEATESRSRPVAFWNVNVAPSLLSLGAGMALSATMKEQYTLYLLHINSGNKNYVQTHWIDDISSYTQMCVSL